jgi:DNA-binding SARP family transcriptional activator
MWPILPTGGWCPRGSLGRPRLGGLGLDLHFDEPPAVPIDGRAERRLPGTGVLLSLIAGFDLTWGGRPVQLPARAQRLVAFLALRDRPVQRQHLAGSIWLDSPDERAMANLRSTLWRVRRAGCPVVQNLGEQLVLDRAVAVDVRQLTDLAHRLFDGSEPGDEEWLSQVVQGGELLPGWDDEWVVAERERVHQLRLHVLELLCERLTAAGRYGRAVEACLAAVNGEPLRESAQRALIKVYLAEGNAGDAVVQYRSYRQLIHDELGLEPSSQMETLVRDLMSR